MTDDSFRGSDREMVRKHEQDLYRGNGKPGITTRIEKLESQMEAIRTDISLLKEMRDVTMNFITEVRTYTLQRDKAEKRWFALIGILIALGTLLVGILMYEHTTGKSVIELKSDVQQAYIINQY